MAHVSLSARDINVLEKIKDPEANPAAGVVIDPSLPRDPHISDAAVYDSLVRRERAVVESIQKIDDDLASSQAAPAPASAVAAYSEAVDRLDALIADHPDYASARNNRAQVLRRLYGDAMLLEAAAAAAAAAAGSPAPLLPEPEPSERRRAALTALRDMERSIALLSPATRQTPLSSQAARTLSMAHTQRAAIYLRTSKLLSHHPLDLDQTRPESRWTKLDFEEAAASDLAYGGRYGNHIAKGLAVSVNPTAKLCGQIVREAMKKEYGPSFEP